MTSPWYICSFELLLPTFIQQYILENLMSRFNVELMVIPHLGDWKKTLITFVFGTFVRKIIGKQKIIGKLFCYAYNDIAVTHGSSNISFIIECATHQIGYLTMQYKCSHDSVKHLKMELLWKYYWLKHWSFLLHKVPFCMLDSFLNQTSYWYYYQNSFLNDILLGWIE